MKIFVFLLPLFLCTPAKSQHKTASRIFINATIWTGDSSNPAAKAMAISDSTILYVGNNYQSYKAGNTQLTDLHGKMIVPGFIDNHTHFLSGGYQLASVNLRYAKSAKDFIQILSDYTNTLTDDRWILGGDWDHETWGGSLPQKNWVDSITGKHPAFVNRYDGHMALANSVCLQLAGINKNTPNPPGGEIVKDAVTGEPTGVLKDEAMSLVYKIMPDPSETELNESLQRGMREAFAHGVTQINDMGSYGGWTDLETYRKAYQNHQLDLRIYSFVPISTWAKLDSFVKQNGRGDNMLHWGGLKGFVDGSLGSTTAWFFKPYLDAPNSAGLQVTDTTLLRRWILQADSAGLHVTVHAIGDHANNWLLNVYEEAERINNHPNRRFRIEHAQHLTAHDIPRFAALHVVASMQPYHAIDDGRWAAKRLDIARLKGTYAFYSIYKTGATLTFGSDWTVAPLDPIAGIYAAVTRRTLDGKNPGGWFPEQKILVDQALRCYTINNAFAGYTENVTGKLKAGMLADFVILSDNLFTVAPQQIRDVKVLSTFVNGKEVYKLKE